jgi:hypothetical protein
MCIAQIAVCFLIKLLCVYCANCCMFIVQIAACVLCKLLYVYWANCCVVIANCCMFIVQIAVRLLNKLLYVYCANCYRFIEQVVVSIFIKILSVYWAIFCVQLHNSTALYCTNTVQTVQSTAELYLLQSHTACRYSTQHNLSNWSLMQSSPARCFTLPCISQYTFSHAVRSDR